MQANMRVVQMYAVQDYSLVAVKLPSSLLLASREAAGALGGASCRSGVARKLSSHLGLCLRKGREAGHSTRLVGKYLEGCFHVYKNSARLLGSVCRGWVGRAGPRPARKPV